MAGISLAPPQKIKNRRSIPTIFHKRLPFSSKQFSRGKKSAYIYNIDSSTERNPFRKETESISFHTETHFSTERKFLHPPNKKKDPGSPYTLLSQLRQYQLPIYSDSPSREYSPKGLSFKLTANPAANQRPKARQGM